ncbi:hypothetical protein EVAR_9070_1 [Eumeta japonica]|uniref:Uncharacterized protein n=1 Tax=Eumeta variegata TaxID=151549 RepID=A0A4C1TWC6_EUMVA|nr:hypothetical protein EVAR_9070_1 [Eumeta japonica]
MARLDLQLDLLERAHIFDLRTRQRQRRRQRELVNPFDLPDTEFMGRVRPEHRVRSKAYAVTLTINEKSRKIRVIQCHDCVASTGNRNESGHVTDRSEVVISVKLQRRRNRDRKRFGVLGLQKIGTTTP